MLPCDAGLGIRADQCGDLGRPRLLKVWGLKIPDGYIDKNTISRSKPSSKDPARIQEIEPTQMTMQRPETYRFSGPCDRYGSNNSHSSRLGPSILLNPDATIRLM